MAGELSVFLRRRFLLFVSIAAMALPSSWVNAAADADPSSCETVWNLPQFLSKPRNQADIGWCYAFSAADLVSAHVGFEVSAADLAVVRNEDTLKQSFHPINKPNLFPIQPLKNGGSTYRTIRLAFANGGKFCREEDFPSSVISYAYPDPEAQRTAIRKLSVARRVKDVLNMGSARQTPRDCHELAGIVSAFPNLLAHDMAAILEKLGEVSGDQDRTFRVAQLAAKNCESNKAPANFDVEAVRREGLSPDLMDALLQKGQVASVGLPTVPVFRAPTDEEKRRYGTNGKALETSDGGHEMLLAGRRWNPVNKKCEYIFKNSWGEVTDAKGTTHGFTALSRETLTNLATADITWVEKKPRWPRMPIPDFLR